MKPYRFGLCEFSVELEGDWKMTLETCRVFGDAKHFKMKKGDLNSKCVSDAEFGSKVIISTKSVAIQ